MNVRRECIHFVSNHNRVIMSNQGAAEANQAPRGNFERHKTFLFIACCVLCLLLEAFILIYSTVNSKHTEEANARFKVALDNIFLHVLSLPLGGRDVRSPLYNASFA